MIDSTVRALLREGAVGWCVLGLAVLALAAPLGLLLMRRAVGWWGEAVLLGHVGVGSALSGATVMLIQLARRRAVASAVWDRTGSAMSPISSIAGAAELSVAAQWVVASFFALSLPIAVGVLGVRSLRGDCHLARGRPGLLPVLAVLMVMPWFASLGVLVHTATDMRNEWLGATPSCRYEALTGAYLPLDSARQGVVAAAIAASVAVSIIAWFRPLRARTAPFALGAASVLAAGLWSWKLAAGMGMDASSPLPLLVAPELPAKLDLPRAVRCIEPGDAPVVSEGSLGFTVDGTAAPDTAQLRALLETKRYLWRLQNPGTPFPGTLYLLLSAEYPAWEAGKLVRVAREAGYRDIKAGVALPAHAVTTRTAGMVQYRPRWCATPLRSGVRWERLPSWAQAVGGDEASAQQ